MIAAKCMISAKGVGRRRGAEGVAGLGEGLHVQ
jgi:hypothetical protein